MPVSWQALSERDRRRAVGLTFVLCVAFIWVAASFLVQVSVSGAGLSPHPWTIISVNSSVLCLCFAIMPGAAWSYNGVLLSSSPMSDGTAIWGLIPARRALPMI